MRVATPTTLTEAIDALAAWPDAHVLAGGTDLMVEVNAGHRRPERVVAIDRVAELQGWHHDPSTGVLRIGAGVPYRALETGEVAALLPALAQAARTVGSPQIRNAGTLGGNLGTCSPAGDGLPVLAALDAVVELASAVGVRRLPVLDFMVGVKRNALQQGELITAVEVVVPHGWQGYAKVGVRNAMVIAVASACLVTDDRERTVRLALGSVGPTVLRASAAEAYAREHLDWGGPVDHETATGFARLAADAARPIDDHRSTAAYRRHAVQVLAARLLRRAVPA